jgi:hypothetical protein
LSRLELGQEQDGKNGGFEQFSTRLKERGLLRNALIHGVANLLTHGARYREREFRNQMEALFSYSMD